MATFDKNNFEFFMAEHAVCMKDGALFINGCSYEEHADEPSYTFARTVAAIMHEASAAPIYQVLAKRIDDIVDNGGSVD